MSATEDRILEQLKNNTVILYMKGAPQAPQCGFSAKVVAALNETGIPFAFVDVLNAPFIREKLPRISHWPTYPQLFVQGELVGGADIIEEMQRAGTLKPLLEAATHQAPA
jgi:monothiol glutaredoxin